MDEMKVVFLSIGERDNLIAILEMARDAGDLTRIAYDPIDQAIKVKFLGRWSLPLGSVDND